MEKNTRRPWLPWWSRAGRRTLFTTWPSKCHCHNRPLSLEFQSGKKPLSFFFRPQDGIDVFERVGRESNSAMFATASFLMMYQEQAVRERKRMRYRAIDESWVNMPSFLKQIYSFDVVSGLAWNIFLLFSYFHLEHKPSLLLIALSSKECVLHVFLIGKMIYI